MPDRTDPTDPTDPTQETPGAGESAADRAPAPGVEAQQRIRRALLHPGRRQLVVGVLLAVLGFAAVTQVRINEADDTYAGAREQELIDVLSALAGTRQRAEEQLAELEQVRDDLQDDTSKQKAALEQAQDDVDDLNILAGQVPVTGPGVRITITEDTGRVSLSSMLDTVQELRTVGAEAMQINGKVRVVAQTAFEETEGGFLVDGQLVEAPYVIDVIGEPTVLSSALEFLLGPSQQIREDGASLVVDELGSLDIESVADLDEPDYTTPDDGE